MDRIITYDFRFKPFCFGKYLKKCHIYINIFKCIQLGAHCFLVWCTLLLSIFISTSLHVSGNYVPIIRRTYCIYATLSGLQTRQPLIQSEKYQCRIDTVSSPDDGHIVTRNK